MKDSDGIDRVKPEPYEPPAIVTIGSVDALTLDAPSGTLDGT